MARKRQRSRQRRGMAQCSPIRKHRHSGKRAWVRLCRCHCSVHISQLAAGRRCHQTLTQSAEQRPRHCLHAVHGPCKGDLLRGRSVGQQCRQVLPHSVRKLHATRGALKHRNAVHSGSQCIQGSLRSGVCLHVCHCLASQRSGTRPPRPRQVCLHNACRLCCQLP